MHHAFIGSISRLALLIPMHCVLGPLEGKYIVLSCQNKKCIFVYCLKLHYIFVIYVNI